MPCAISPRSQDVFHCGAMSCPPLHNTLKAEAPPDSEAEDVNDSQAVTVKQCAVSPSKVI